MIATLFALTLAASDVATYGFGLVIASDSDCPSAADVREQLGDLTFPSPDAASVAVHGVDDEVTVVFGAPAGLQRGPRTLILPRECPRRASAVALLIAAWLGQVPAQRPTMTLVAPPPRPRPPPPAPPSPPRAPAVQSWEASLSGALEVLPGESTVPGAALGIGHGTEGNGLGWVVGLSTQLTSTGEYHHWLRPVIEADLRLRAMVSETLALDVLGGPAFGLLLSGRVTGIQHVTPNVGLGMALRGGFTHRLGATWWELRGRSWFSHGEDDPERFDQLDLPSVEVLFSMGWSFRP